MHGVAEARGLSRDRIDGGLALVSHRGRRKAGIGWSFDGLELRSPDLENWLDREDHSWGPVLATTYTLDRGDDGVHALRLTALFPPLEADEIGDVALELETRDGAWRPVGTATLEDRSFTARFHVPDVDEHLGRAYRVVGEVDGRAFERRACCTSPDRSADPDRRDELREERHHCHTAWNRDSVWFPHDDLVERVATHEPDLYFFAGDQIYEGDINGVDRSRIVLDYHTKFQRWLRSFGELVRDRPSVIIPDDHDVYHGNIWGAGGIRAKARDGLSQQDAGGYKLEAGMVNAVHRTQVGNLPEPKVPGPIGQGIEPYATRLRYGPIDAASSPIACGRTPPACWSPRDRFETAGSGTRTSIRGMPTSPRPGSSARRRRRSSPSGRSTVIREPAAPSQPDARVNVATLPPGKDDGVVPRLKIFPADGYAADDVPAADTDSGGWPQSARLRAVRSISAADAIHLAGDQHLGSLLQYGMDGFRDGLRLHPAGGREHVAASVDADRTGREPLGGALAMPVTSSMDSATS